jgi:ABC-2 type transport system permease protein
VCCLVGVAALLFGVAPRAVGAAWAAVVACFLIWVVGPILDAPGWVLDLSPFHHVPALPAAPLDAAPLVALTGVAAALTSAGLFLLQRRDVRPGS